MAQKREPSPGWIDCDGSGCPVSLDTIVQIQFRHDLDRATAERLSGPGVPASTFPGWVHTGAGTDIVGCREMVR